MHEAPILQCLKKHGQKFGVEIAAATGISLLKVPAPSRMRRISRCSATRFNDGNPVDGMLS